MAVPSAAAAASAGCTRASPQHADAARLDLLGAHLAAVVDAVVDRLAPSGLHLRVAVRQQGQHQAHRLLVGRVHDVQAARFRHDVGQFGHVRDP
ncbi:hypothetical protein G6F65_014911 [Rhizopus arrhizus]|nr:hypothetical protein G6F65_014911 [Rhizopus arrhizus]